MIPAHYPKADRSTQWFFDDYPGVEMEQLQKLLLHTTEGSGWPSYDGGAKAPQLTYHPRLHSWRQHLPLNRSARALQDPESTPVRENRDGVIQVEIICSCDAAYADRNNLQHVTELDDQAIDDLGEFAGWLHTEAGLVLQRAPLWLPYPQSGRDDSEARMTSAEFDAFQGVCGHMHASGNEHGDPGAIPINQIMVAAATHAEGDGTTMWTDDQIERAVKAVEAIAADQVVIKREVLGLNARMGYVANEGMKDVDALRDKLAGPD